MKKKILLCTLSVVLIVAIGFTVYVFNGSKVRENYVMEYLESKGYTDSQIQNIKAEYSFFNGILGYQTWAINVVFADEPDFTYTYLYDSKAGVSQGSVTGGDINTKKEDFKHGER